MSYKNGAIIIEGHVQGLSNTRSLGEAGIPVYVVDTTNCIAKHSRYCQNFFRCPEYKSDEFAYFLIDLAKKEKIRDWLLLPSNDHAVYTLSKHKSELEKYYKLITPRLEVIDNIYDKAKLLNLAEKCGVPIPATQYFSALDESLAQILSFPLITRGRNGLSFYKAVGKKALIAVDEEELRFQLRELEKKIDINRTLTQDVIPDGGSNRTISFAAFCEHGEIKNYWMGVKLRQHPVEFGTATFAKSIYVQNCYDLSVPLLKALDYTGVCEVEYLQDPRDGQFKLIEINARTWLWVGLAKACGVDFAKMAYEYTNGMDSEYPKEYETGVNWINPITDVVYSAKAILKGQFTANDYLKSLNNGKKVNALFAKDDWKPGLAFMFNTFSYLSQR